MGKLVKESGVIGETLTADLAHLESANIPVVIVFKQGKQVLELLHSSQLHSLLLYLALQVFSPINRQKTLIE